VVRIPASAATVDPLAATSRLTLRDRLLLSWLAEHYVLTSQQIAQALFPSGRAAQKRLTLLHRIGAVSRFRFAQTDEQSSSYRYTLGPLGVHLFPTPYTDPGHPAAKTPRTHLERRARIIRHIEAGSHLLGVNQFFIDLYTATRTQPGAVLARWWSEQHATAAYAHTIRPDGHGVWCVGDAQVGFFLELDNATEDLPRVVKKLSGYVKVAEFGPRYPVLLWVPDRRREASLLRALAGTRTPMAVATAVHATNPAGPVWALPASPGPRLHLHELPSDHGPAQATNPNAFHR
jgi:hypothetical protein